MAGFRRIAVAGALVVAPLVPGITPGIPPGSGDDPSDPPPAQQQPDQQAKAQHPAPSEKARRACDLMAAPWGSDGASGSADDPFRTPRRLTKGLQRRQTGCLRGGEYRQTQVTVKKPRITLRSAPGERATWRGRVVLEGAADRLVDLTLDGSGGPRCQGRNCGTLPSPTISAPRVVVALSDITNPGAGICVASHAWRGHTANRFLIERNRIHDCGRRPPTGHDHGIYIADGRGGTIRDNVIYDNADRGIQLFPDARSTTIVHNTVDGNGSGIIYSERSSWNRVSGNVFSDSVVRWNAEAWRLSGGGNSFVGNCVHPANPDPGYNEDGGVALPPIVRQAGTRRSADNPYRDRRAGDFRLVDGSPCAGRGAPDSVAAPEGG